MLCPSRCEQEFAGGYKDHFVDVNKMVDNGGHKFSYVGHFVTRWWLSRVTLIGYPDNTVQLGLLA